MKSNESHTPELTPSLSHVAETCLFTFYCHALESQSPDPILKDEKAVEITGRITPMLAGSENKLLRSLYLGRIRKEMVVHIALRARRYDDYARDFIARHPDGIVINLGCGMDSRFHRIDNGKLLFFDLDLPEVIEFRRRFYQENERYHMLACSVFDYKWMHALLAYGKRPILYLAEGLFMYLEADKVKALLLELQKRFGGSELVFETVNKRWLSPMMKTMMRIKMQKQIKFGENANFQFGLSDGREMESWHAGIKFLDEWCYFDTNHPKLGWMRIFRKSKLFLRAQWTVHYLLG